MRADEGDDDGKRGVGDAKARETKDETRRAAKARETKKRREELQSKRCEEGKKRAAAAATAAATVERWAGGRGGSQGARAKGRPNIKGNE